MRIRLRGLGSRVEGLVRLVPNPLPCHKQLGERHGITSALISHDPTNPYLGLRVEGMRFRVKGLGFSRGLRV